MLSSKPSQYKKGYVEWYKLNFKVTPAVLIPRPETEALVDEVLGAIRSDITILDIGTGSGCISISIAKNSSFHPRGVRLNSKIIATDISPKALKIARQNAKLHGVEEKITFVQSDLLSVFCNSSLIAQGDSLMIVANLPYIPTQRIPQLDSSVKDFEPHIALDGGEDGFALYRRLFQEIKEKKLGLSCFIGEIDYTQSKLAIAEAKKFFPDAHIEVKPDLAHKPRILIIRL